jgi:hypothetical protein
MRKFIGVDVGKDNLDFCWLRDNKTGKNKSKKFRNKSEVFSDVASWIVKVWRSTPNFKITGSLR